MFINGTPFKEFEAVTICDQFIFLWLPSPLHSTTLDNPTRVTPFSLNLGAASFRASIVSG